MLAMLGLTGAMMQAVPSELQAHDERLGRLERSASGAAVAAWGEVDPARISESWEAVIPPVAAVVTGAQQKAADSGVRASREVSVSTGQYELPEAFQNPRELAGYGSHGVPIEDALYSPVIGVKERIAVGTPAAEAMLYGANALAALATTVVADTGREAMQMDMIARKQAGYVRVVEAGACARCIVLAGKFFRWNKGFDRHPRCRCEHMPAKSEQWAKDEGWYADPYEAFRAMSEGERRRVFGEFSARAIDDGADIFQVVNATGPRSGMYAGGRMTREGTSRHGNFRRTSPHRQRLTPYGIYGDGSRSRDEALKALRENGYILPGGQDPAGTMRNLRAPAKGASKATRESWLTGTRLPRNMQTMTAAEKRAYRADRDWQMVRAGMNPYQAGAAQRWRFLVHGEGTPHGGSLPRPLTDTDRANAESAYRRYVLGLDGGDPAIRPTR
jgi:hypothetical protein